MAIFSYRYDAMEYGSIVISSFSKFCEVFACLLDHQVINDLEIQQNEIKLHTRGAWSQYSSNCTSPKLVSSTTESMFAVHSLIRSGGY